MKNIDGFADYYCISEDGKIYNLRTNRELKATQRNSYRLKTVQGTYKIVTLKELFRIAYNREYSIDEIENLDGEQWREIPRTNGCYYCSNKGRIKSLKGYRAIIMKPTLLNDYPRVQIYLDDNRRKDMFVHTLVAICWLEQPLQSPLQEYDIHHKDLTKDNCCADNLCYIKKEEHYKLHKLLRGRKSSEGNQTV